MEWNCAHFFKFFPHKLLQFYLRESSRELEVFNPCTIDNGSIHGAPSNIDTFQKNIHDAYTKDLNRQIKIARNVMVHVRQGNETNHMRSREWKRQEQNARQNKTRQDKTSSRQDWYGRIKRRHEYVRQGKTRQTKTRQSKTRKHKTKTRQDKTR